MRTVAKIALMVVVIVVGLGVVVGVFAGGILWFHYQREARIAATGIPLMYEVESNPPAAIVTPELTKSVLTVLKRRIDPEGRRDLAYRLVGTNRIEIIVPRPDAAAMAAYQQCQDSMKEIIAANLQDVEVRAVIAQPLAARDANITELAPTGTPRHELLVKLAAAADALKAIRKETAKVGDPTKLDSALISRLAVSQEQVRTIESELRNTNIDVYKLSSLLVASEDPKNLAARSEIAALPGRYSLQRAMLERLIAAHERLTALGGIGPDSPDEIDRIVTSAGVLDFRIAVRLGDEKSEVIERARRSLSERGPGTPIPPNLCWCAVDENARDDFQSETFIVDTWASQSYLLLYDDLSRTLTHGAGRPKWAISRSCLTTDPRSGNLALSFGFDLAGKALFGELTADNVSHPMAILLDDKAMSAPNINEAIPNGSCQITFGTVTATHTAQMIRKEAVNLRLILDAGSLPARLKRVP